MRAAPPPSSFRQSCGSTRRMLPAFSPAFCLPTKDAGRLDYASFRPQEERGPGPTPAPPRMTCCTPTPSPLGLPVERASCASSTIFGTPRERADWVVSDPFPVLARLYAPEQISLSSKRKLRQPGAAFDC